MKATFKQTRTTFPLGELGRDKKLLHLKMLPNYADAASMDAHMAVFLSYPTETIDPAQARTFMPKLMTQTVATNSSSSSKGEIILSLLSLQFSSSFDRFASSTHPPTRAHTHILLIGSLKCPQSLTFCNRIIWTALSISFIFTKTSFERHARALKVIQ